MEMTLRSVLSNVGSNPTGTFQSIGKQIVVKLNNHKYG